ncbi:KCNH2, partial [Symbiodinium microadriaticum]
KLANPRIDFMILRAQKTKQFEIEKPWYIINPDSSSLFTVWQGLSFLALTFVALITPIQVGLIAEYKFDTLAAVSLCVDGIFLVDLLMQFCTTYSKKTVRGTIWETKVSAISQQYLRSWFVLDVMSLFPFDLIGLMIGGSGGNNFAELKSIKVLRVLRLLKLTRLLKGSKIIQRLEIPVAIPYQHLALVRFMFVLMMACHWLACLWAMTLQLVEPEFPRWINDIESSDLEFGIESSKSPLRIYVAAFYFCAYTMTSVGYGDIGPKNILERLVCCGIILSAGLCWAYILGEVCGIVADMTSESQEFRKRMYHLNCMMKMQELPRELKARLRSFFLQNRHQVQFLTQQTLLRDMSPQLQSEVSTVLNLTWIQKVTFFSQFLNFLELQETRGVHVVPYKACIADIAKALKASAFAQRESFDNVQVLYILSKGLVALDSRVGYNGAVWGEDFVLSDTSLIRPVAGYALTYIEVLYLTRDALMEVIERRKASCPQLGRIVRQYCVRVAVFRGILAEAKRRSKGSAGQSVTPQMGRSGSPQKQSQALKDQSRPCTARTRCPETPGFGCRPVPMHQQDVVMPDPPPAPRPPQPKFPMWEEV